MLCQLCQKRVAGVHYTQVINNSKVELYLCEQCAKEQGQFGFGSSFSIDDFFSGLIGYGGGSAYTGPALQQPVCTKCGMSYEEFQKVGRLGCSSCYETFGSRLHPVLKRLHGNVEHHGKVPGKTVKKDKVSKQVNDLKEALEAAVRNEQYEKAAELRDKIRAIEAGIEKKA